MKYIFIYNNDVQHCTARSNSLKIILIFYKKHVYNQQIDSTKQTINKDLL